MKRERIKILLSVVITALLCSAVFYFGPLICGDRTVAVLTPARSDLPVRIEVVVTGGATIRDIRAFYGLCTLDMQVNYRYPLISKYIREILSGFTHLEVKFIDEKTAQVSMR